MEAIQCLTFSLLVAYSYLFYAEEASEKANDKEFKLEDKGKNWEAATWYGSYGGETRKQ